MSPQEFQIPTGKYPESIADIYENANTENNIEANTTNSNCVSYDEVKARREAIAAAECVENKETIILDSHVIALNVGNALDFLRHDELLENIGFPSKFENLDIAA